ncbi:glycosyltransferase family 4 protein [Phosphitispora sp. TUW77]|uniref:glycosyltransferase family 4 protein n=1 Tax=Phosphitispora sp. TUW77 TaxID=3152361 RepID=UPI003AB3193F
MRILELITLGEVGGAQSVLIDLLKGFYRMGYEADVDVVFGEGSYIPKELDGWFKGKTIQTPYFTRNVNPVKDFKALKMIQKLCKENSYDLIHCHSSKASYIGRIAGILAGIPRICMTVHGVSFAPGHSGAARRMYSALERMLFPLRAEYIFVSPVDMETFIKMGLAREKCRLVPNGRPIPDKPEKGLRELLKIEDLSPLICMIGRMSEIKNPRSFIRIAKGVIERYPKNRVKLSFVLIGEGPLFDQCNQMVDSENLSGYVHLLGNVENAARYFWNTNIALLTSRYEACPLVLIEAMAAGTPVVATDVGGNKYIVEHGETGYLFSEGNEEEAVVQIINILNNDNLLKEMGCKCFRHYQESFTVDRMVEQYASIFGLTKNSGAIVDG